MAWGFEGPPPMTTKMKKGIMKPLRYISQIFDGKEHELQIGFPTDVKHVAHIGWDGPNVNAPSWMKDFHSAPLSSASYATEERESSPRNLWASQEINFQGGLEGSPQQESIRPARRAGASSSDDRTVDSPSNSPKSTKPRHARRHQSDGTAAIDPSNRDPSTDRAKKGRRHRKKEGGPNGPPTDAAPGAQELPAIPKQSHRRRIKGSGESGGSTRPSRLKDTTSASPSPSMPSAPSGAGPEGRPDGPVPVLKPMNEEEEGL